MSTPLHPGEGVIARDAAPLRRQVVAQLRQAIVEGRLTPGTRLIERQLIASLRVSRTVIRESLRELESEGLVTLIPNTGPIVRELTVCEAADLYAIRGVLEGLAARLFAQRAGPSHVTALLDALGRTASAYTTGDPDRIFTSKNEFYRALFDGAGSETLSAMIGALHGRISRWRALGLRHPRRSPSRSAETVRNLRALVGALKRKQPDEAERIMRREVERAAAEVMALLTSPKPRGR
jgi:DNA-binding GntR family transcriptional regulator